MAQAEALLREIEAEIKEVDGQIRQHRYPVSFREGDLPLEAIVPFLGHQYHIAHSDIQAMALMLNHFSDRPSADFFRGLLEGEFLGLAGIITMGEKLGLSEARLQAMEPRPDGFAYAAYTNWLASKASEATVLTGLLLNFSAWCYNCGQLGTGLREQHGWVRTETAFVDGFAELPSFEHVVVPELQQALDHGEPVAPIKRAVRLIQGYELMFWEAMALEAGI